MQHNIFFSTFSMLWLNKIIIFIADHLSFQQSLWECNPSSQHPSKMSFMLSNPQMVSFFQVESSSKFLGQRHLSSHIHISPVQSLDHTILKGWCHFWGKPTQPDIVFCVKLVSLKCILGRNVPHQWCSRVKQVSWYVYCRVFNVYFTWCVKPVSLFSFRQTLQMMSLESNRLCLIGLLSSSKPHQTVSMETGKSQLMVSKF